MLSLVGVVTLETSASVAAVASRMNVGIVTVLLTFPASSVTVIVQSE